MTFCIGQVTLDAASPAEPLRANDVDATLNTSPALQYVTPEIRRIKELEAVPDTEEAVYPSGQDQESHHNLDQLFDGRCRLFTC